MRVSVIVTLVLHAIVPCIWIFNDAQWSWESLTNVSRGLIVFWINEKAVGGWLKILSGDIPLVDRCFDERNGCRQSSFHYSTEYVERYYGNVALVKVFLLIILVASCGLDFWLCVTELWINGQLRFARGMGNGEYVDWREKVVQKDCFCSLCYWHFLVEIIQLIIENFFGLVLHSLYYWIIHRLALGSLYH